MKIGLRGGHSANCIGAVGYINEYVECQKIYERVAKLLRSVGDTVIDCNSNAYNANAELAEGTNKANANKVDFFASIHMNAGGGTGCEVWAYNSSSDLSVKIGSRICENISGQLKIANRGVKYSTGLHDLRCTNMQSIIIECLFVDTARDVAACNLDKIARSIANGIDNRVSLQAEAPKQEVIYDMDKIVVYYGDIDSFAAIIVSQKYNAPLMKLSDYKASGLKAKNVIQIGGNAGENTRFDTFKNAAKLL